MCYTVGATMPGRSICSTRSAVRIARSCSLCVFILIAGSQEYSTMFVAIC